MNAYTDITAEYTTIDPADLLEGVTFHTCARDGGEYSDETACVNGQGAGSAFRRDGEVISRLSNGSEILVAALAERLALVASEAESLQEHEGLPSDEAIEAAYYDTRSSWGHHVEMTLANVGGEGVFRIDAGIWEGDTFVSASRGVIA